MISDLSRARPLVAIVDDEESIRKSLRRLLMAADLDAVVYASGQEFLDALRGRHPDCLILDLQMPGLTGLEVQRALTAAGCSSRRSSSPRTTSRRPGPGAWAPGSPRISASHSTTSCCCDAIANVMGRVGAPAGTEDHKRA